MPRHIDYSVAEYWYLEYHKLYFELASLRDRIEQAKFFNQRAGRELWQDKPKEVQDRDIKSYDEFYDTLLQLIDGYRPGAHCVKENKK